MQKLAKRKIAIRFPPSDLESPERFLERLSSQIKTSFTRIEIVGDTIIIEMAGDAASIRESLIRIKGLQEEYKGSIRKSSGEKREYNARKIYRDIGLAIPLDVLIEALRRNGWSAEESNSGIKTNASYEDVISIARLIAGAIEGMKHLEAARGAKKALAVAAAVTGAPLEDAVRAGIEVGVLMEDDTGKLLTRVPWREAAREIISRLARW